MFKRGKVNPLAIALVIFCHLSFLSGQAQFTDVTSSNNFQPVIAGDTHGGGVSAVDFDGDGDLDLYICSEKGYQDQLYINDNGQYSAAEEQWGLTSMDRSRMALWMDIDGDKDLDLLVAGDCDFDENDCTDTSHLKLYEQQDGAFTNIATAAGLDSFGPKLKDQTIGGLAAADINEDGYVDFVVAIRNGPLEVFINNGDRTFTESASLLGFDTEYLKYYQPFFHDIDRDGYIDLYCNVDFGENTLWLNSPGNTFIERARVTNANNAFNEMGVALGDYDRDGDFDIYATNIYSYLGQDVYNILLRYDQGLSDQFFFTEQAKELGIENGGWGWGVSFFDANNDGYLDLATTNGFDRPFEVVDQSKMWLQQSNGSFTNVSSVWGFDDELNGVSLITLDYDRDGDLDMIQTLKGFDEETVPLRLLENTISDLERGNYLVVKPRMEGNNHFSIGAEIRAYVDGVVFARLIHAGTSFYGQEPAEAFIGLGDATLIDSLSITWPGGAMSWMYDVAVNQEIIVTDEDVVHRPGDFSVDQQGAYFLLSWSDLTSNETGYQIEKSDNPDFTDAEFITLPPNTTSYTDTEIELSEYHYRIRTLGATAVSNDAGPIAQTFDPLGMDDDTDLLIYPNPTKNKVYVRHGMGYRGAISLLDLSGKVLKRISSNAKANETLLELEYPFPGIYLLQIGKKTIRLVIE